MIKVIIYALSKLAQSSYVHTEIFELEKIKYKKKPFFLDFNILTIKTSYRAIYE